MSSIEHQRGDRWLSKEASKDMTDQNQDTLEQAISPPHEPPPVEAMCDVHVERGWVTVKWESILEASPGMMGVLEEFRRTLPEWKNHITDEWWYGLRPYDAVDAVANCVHMGEMMGPDSRLQLSRKVTASGILFEKPIPQALFVLDQHVVDIVMRYKVLTTPVRVDLAVMSGWQPYLPVPNLADVVRSIAHNQHLMYHIFGEKLQPNLVFMRTHLGFPMNLSASFTPDQLRKVMTCLFLTAGLPVPLDYLYVDMEVNDYVLKTGDYEIVKTYHP